MDDIVSPLNCYSSKARLNKDQWTTDNELSQEELINDATNDANNYNKKRRSSSASTVPESNVSQLF